MLVLGSTSRGLLQASASHVWGRLLPARGPSGNWFPKWLLLPPEHKVSRIQATAASSAPSFFSYFSYCDNAYKTCDSALNHSKVCDTVGLKYILIVGHSFPHGTVSWETKTHASHLPPSLPTPFLSGFRPPDSPVCLYLSDCPGYLI